jgi:hypothetical protein
MPAKQDGAITLTFSKKNQDAKEKILEAEKNGWKQTDYICAAVRAFNETSQQNDSSIDKSSIEKLVDELVSKKIKELGTGAALDERVVENEINNKIYSLEENLEGINVGDD